MPMNRCLLAACCALLSLPAWAQQRVKPPSGLSCTFQAAQCSLSLPVLNFGRQVLTQSTPPILGHNTVAVSCTLSPLADARNVTVNYTLKAEPAEPSRHMRNRPLDEWSYIRYYLYLDSARTQHWGDGAQYGTHAIQGSIFLNSRNRVGTIPHTIYATVDGGQVAQPGPALGAVLSRLEYTLNCE